MTTTKDQEELKPCPFDPKKEFRVYSVSEIASLAEYQENQDSRVVLYAQAKRLIDEGKARETALLEALKAAQQALESIDRCSPQTGKLIDASLTAINKILERK